MKKLFLYVALVIILGSGAVGCVQQSKTQSSQIPSSSTLPVKPSGSESPSTQSNSQSLAGTSWTLKSLGDTSNMIPLVIGRAITLRFYGTGSYMGNPGYTGSYGGAYNTEGNTIWIGATTWSAVSAPDDPPGFLEQHHTYCSLLSRARDFKIMDDELMINCTDGKSLLFSRIIDSPK